MNVREDRSTRSLWIVTIVVTVAILLIAVVFFLLRNIY